MSGVSRTRSTDKRFYGVVQGVVTDLNDSDGKEGRVKVQFPWFDDQMETEWCRVRQFYAGNGYGAFFVPEVGDEVLVAFIHGDMRMPIILGGLYNGKDKPPTHRSADLDQKMIRTKAGHELLFDDTSGKQRVRITTQGGHNADLSDVDQKITLQSSSGQTVVVDDSASLIKISSGSCTVTIDGVSGTITLAGTTVVLTATNVALGGAVAAHPLVLGDALLAAFNTHTHNCTAPGTPSGPPIPPLLPTALSTISKTV
jgi:phage baseplate assembly protein V